VGTKGWKKLLLVFVVLMGVMLPISRMVLGSHSGDQVLYAIFNSIAAGVLYRYIIQGKIYKLMKNSLQGRHFRSILTLNTFFLLVTLAIPVIFYEINTASRPY
jgi:hypothetical protein